jgi:Amidases related to nicotinamidase
MAEKLSIVFEKTAFVAIDLQQGIVNRELAPYKSADVIANAAKLADAFRKNGAFVVLVNVTSKDGKDTLKGIADQPMQWGRSMTPEEWARMSELVPELNRQQSDLIITKRQWGAFYGTELDLQLRRRGIDTILLCGISTNIGVETTARDAYQRGYNIIIAEDACTASSAEEHDNSKKFIFPRIARIRTTEEILEALK